MTSRVHKIALLGALAFSAALAPAAAAEGAPPAAAPDSELSLFQLDEVLSQEVEIASRRKESTALAASIISVIDRARIDREGARTLQELLRTVVGFHTRRTESNGWAVALRGYDTPANFLVMVDGHRLNDPLDGSVPWDLPLENVRRIEILRGPGSAVYGTNAFVGVVNVITFDDDQRMEARLFGYSNDSEYRSVLGFPQPMVGGALRGGTLLGKLRVDAHATFREDRGAALQVPSDLASLTNRPWSLARCVDGAGTTVNKPGTQIPILRVSDCEQAGGTWNGRTQEQVRHGEGSLRLKLGALEWITRLAGDYRGAGLGDPDTTHLYLAYQTRRQELGAFSQLSFTHDLDEVTHLRLRALYDERHHRERVGRAPEGFVDDSGTVFPEGLSTLSSSISRSFGAEATGERDFELSQGFLGGVNLDVGVGANRRQVDHSSYLANFGDGQPGPHGFNDVSQGLPPLVFPGTTDPRPECGGGAICTDGRFVNAVAGWGQARWQPHLPVSGLLAAATLGVRADRESSFGTVISPRAGITVVADDAALPISSKLVKALLPDNVKVLFGSAFRSPTIKERFDNLAGTFFGNPDLVPETIRSMEAGVGYRLADVGVVFANYFRSDIQNSIQRLYASAGTEPLRQRSDRQVSGVELEVRGGGWRISDAYFNVSRFSGTDHGDVPGFPEPVTTHLEDQPKLSANAGLEVQAWRWIFVGVLASYVDEQQNVQRTLTERSHTFVIPAYFVLNPAIRLREPVPGVSVQLYARNILSTVYKDPLPVNHDQDVKLTPGDKVSYLLPRERFSFGIALSYQP